MRLKTLLAFLLCSFSFESISQTINIIDEATGKPISDVFVYHENKTNVSYSDEKGIADISDFPSGLIFVQHPSYYEKSVAYLGSNISFSLAEKIVSFNEVVISANKWEQDEERITQQIKRVGKKTIDFQNPQTSADLLANTGQVFVQKSQLGGGSPKLRGFAANSVLLVVDGVRMNNAIFRSGNLQNVINIDPNALASSEVVFGPGSVIYGSDALGGVMDFHTIEPKWATDQKGTVTGTVLGRYSSAAQERTGHLDLSVSEKKFTFFHSTTFTALDDLMAGSNRSRRYEGEFERRFFAQRVDGEDQLIRNEKVDLQKFSGLNLFNTVNKAKVRLGKSADLSYGFYYSTTSDIPRYDNLTETVGETDSLQAAEWYYGPQEWQMHNIRLSIYKPTSLFDQARVTVGYQLFEESRNDRNFGDDRLRTRIEKVDMYTLSIDLDKDLTKANLYYGFDFFHNDVRSTAFRTNIETGRIGPTSSRYPDGGSTYSSAAFYGSLTFDIASRLVLNSGVRFNLVSLNASTNDPFALISGFPSLNINNSAVNGALGLAWNFKEGRRVSYNLATGFRAPNIDDVGKLFEVGSSIVVPNPDLEPEYTVSNEIAYEQKSDRMLLQVIGFYSQLLNAIVDGPYTVNGISQFNERDIFAKVNADKARIYGASLILQVELSRVLALEKSISIVEGRDISNDQPLRHTTPIFGRTSLIHKVKKLRSEFFIEYNGNRNRTDIPVSEIDRKAYLYTSSGSPGWYTLNVTSSYQVSQHLKANFGVENILDIHYRPYTSGISAPGRNFIVSLRATI